MFNDISRDCDVILCNAPGKERKPENTRLMAFFRIIFLENRLEMAGRNAIANQLYNTDTHTTK